MAQVFDAVTTTSLSVDGVDVTAHKLRHELGGADALSLVGLSGLLADPQKVSVQDEGTLVNSRTIINFTGSGVAVSDDGGNSRVNVIISGGSGVGITVQENGSTVESTATVLNFQNGIIATSGGSNIANLNIDYGTSTQPLGTAAAGTSVTLSRADHVHAHGDQAGGTLHPVVTTSVNGFMSAADKTLINKLDPNGGFASQASFVERTTIFTTSSTTYVAFLTTTFTTSSTAAFLVINFTCGAQAANGTATMFFAVFVGGTFRRNIGVRVSSAGQPQPTSIVMRVVATASTSTTVEIRAKTSASTLTCDPFDGTLGIDGHHASLLVTEIST
jgi:Tfp pilus assembly protein FimT